MLKMSAPNQTESESGLSFLELSD